MASKMKPIKIETFFFRHWFAIWAGPSRGDLTPVRIWEDLPFEVFHKWRWYFDYRTALCKVQHPRWIVERRWGSVKAEKPGAEHLKRVKDRITSKKAKITEYTNKINRYREAWTSLFPIEEDGPYTAALAKIELKRKELAVMEDEYEELLKKHNNAPGTST